MASLDNVDVLTHRGDDSAFAVSGVERVDITAQTALLCITGALDAPSRTEPPRLIVMGAGNTESIRPTSAGPVASRPATAGPRPWQAEYVVSSRAITDPASTLHLLLPDGRLVNLPTPSAPSPPAPPPAAVPASKRRRLLRAVAGTSAAAACAAAGYAVGHAQRTPAAAQRTPAAAQRTPAAARPEVAVASRSEPPKLDRFTDYVLNGAQPRFPLTSPYPHPPTYIVPPPGTALVARATVSRVAVFPSATGTTPKRFLLSPNAAGSPAAFLVKGEDAGRVEVGLPTRPNGSTGWVNIGDLVLAIDPFRLDIDLTRHELTLTRYDKVVERDAIGVGKSLTPTPSGTYFVTALLRLTDPNGIYGPFAFATSAHSTIFNEFEGGNGRIGVHGTNQPEAIGNSISHGCIRVLNTTIRRLAKIVPLGTPVRIHR